MEFEVPHELLPLINGFICRRELDLVNLRKCLVTKDYRTIFTIAHRLKGNGISYGFPEMSEIGKDLEEAAQEQNDGLSRAKVDVLDELVRKISAHFASVSS